MLIEEFLDRLDGVRSHSNGFTARCPSHDDRIPSLSVREADNRILVYCFAGCKLEEICEAVGITVKDLFMDEYLDDVPSANVIEESYIYTNEEGDYIFEKVRLANKRFQIWGDYAPTLYRLPDLVKAVERGDEVWIVEGEKDVETLRRQGVIATTSGSHNSWNARFVKRFLGASVTIVADKDDVGRKYAEEIKESLETIAEEVRIVESAFGKDITDHIMAGYKVKEVVTIG